MKQLLPELKYEAIAKSHLKGFSGLQCMASVAVPSLFSGATLRSRK
ncbi:MAG: hypothetical protein HRT88_17350 [Lentisphaeraceae bacterium]|nr:hypothetical protein [Lentisphaeraceae bacterium]